MARNIVYFIGAGLTKALELAPKRVPVMNDFVAVLAERFEDPVIRTHLAHLEIADFFEHPSPEARDLVIEMLVKENSSAEVRDQLQAAFRNRAPENIETLIDRAARTRRGSNPLSYLDRDEWKDPEVGARVMRYFAHGEAPLRFNFAIHAYFAWIGWDLRLDVLRRFLAARFALPGTEHAFVSFNYDLALDRCLQESGRWDFRDGYLVPVRQVLRSGQTKAEETQARADTPEVRLLKPHGSLNWLMPFEGQYEFHTGPVTVSVDDDGIVSYPAEYSVENLGLFLYPPFTAKSQYSFIRDICDAEAEAVRNAAEVYVIGWSMPTTDARQVKLIRDARPNAIQRVVAVNYYAPDAYFEELADAFGVDPSQVVRENRGFTEYVERTSVPS